MITKNQAKEIATYIWNNVSEEGFVDFNPSPVNVDGKSIYNYTSPVATVTEYGHLYDCLPSLAGFALSDSFIRFKRVGVDKIEINLSRFIP
jgi:hypothetical protein